MGTRTHMLRRSGFTLIETIVAFAILLAAVVGPVSLVTRGLFTAFFVKNKLTATNLAQEGIELVRQARDNNVACDKLNGPAVWQWNRDPSGGNLTNTSREADALTLTSISCGAATIATPLLPLFTGSKLRFDPATSLYSYGGPQESRFVRRLDIQVPPGSGHDSDIPASNQMDVASTVTWIERGITKSLTLRERLYDWR